MSELMKKFYVKALIAKYNALEHLKNECGETNLVAIILILAIVVVLVILFKDKLTDIVGDIWNKIGGDVNTALR